MNKEGPISTHVIVFGLEVEVDKERGPRHGGKLDVVVCHGAGDLPGHHVEQQHLLEHLGVLHQAGHQVSRERLNGLIGGGKHSQWPVTWQIQSVNNHTENQKVGSESLSYHL